MSKNLTDAEKELSAAWYAAVEDLKLICLISDSQADRIKAAETILDFCIAMGQSINRPFMPEMQKKEFEDTDEDD